jgi:arylesterase/paraoxonase
MGSKLPPSLILLVVSVILYSQSWSLWKLVGRADIDKTRLVKWENHTVLNNGDCSVIKEANGCEDVKIHFASNTAFLACGDPYERTKWYPCAGQRDASGRSEASFREQLFKYDLKNGKLTELSIQGLEGDLITHGLDIYEIPGEPAKVCDQLPSQIRGADKLDSYIRR